MSIRIGLADDHQLFLKSLSMLVSSLPGYEVVLEALNGQECLTRIRQLSAPPDILLIDLNMPVLDGHQTAKTIASEFPSVKMAALSMKSDDRSIINMIKAGCCAYLMKEIHPNELERALDQMHRVGYYNADAANINYRRLLLFQQEEEQLSITPKEKIFMQFASSDLTYKQIAAEMSLAERTIDGYREILFKKLNVQSRVGLVLEALRRNIIQL
jgi:DNA-binding NarL/FixJ family response regulator